MELVFGRHGRGIHSVSVETSAVTLKYRMRRDGQPWNDLSQEIQLDRTPCNFGGSRDWFRCPDCRRRVCLLYLDSRFSCRECLDLGYLSQRQLDWEREVDRALEIRDLLGWKGDLLSPHRSKPKGMHWQTYFDLCADYDDLVHHVFRKALRR